MASKNYAVVGAGCVSCGSCLKVCPKAALSIWKGVTAVVDESLCIGCGKCMRECPAGIIALRQREVAV